MQTRIDREELRSALRRMARLMRRRSRPQRRPRLPPRPASVRPARPISRAPRLRPEHLLLVFSGLGFGLLLSALLLTALQWFWPQGQYFTRIQIPLARQWELPQRESIGWASYAYGLARSDEPTRALAAYGMAVALLDTQAGPVSHDLRRQIQAQMEAVSRGRSDVEPLIRPTWAASLLQLVANPLLPAAWQDALVFFPLVQEPQVVVLLMLSLWLGLSFVRALQDQMAWTRILDQERPLSLGRILPPTLGAGLVTILLVALVTLSPSQPVMVSVVCGAAVPGLCVQILNRSYQLRARRALAAWETQHRAEFSSELHNTAQQSIMSAQVILREVIQELETSDEPEAGHYAWQLAEAMERCQEVEDELRVLRNGTEDKFARGQNFVAAIEPICDRLQRRDVNLNLAWLWENQPVPATAWEQMAFDLAGSPRDRRIAATLYQVLSELTWNVLKYACRDGEPVRLDIVFNCLRQGSLVRYTLDVRDDGPGFDVQTAQDRRPHSGIFALERYLRRVEIVGAQARSTIDTAPGAGTRVFTEIVSRRT